MTDITAEGFRFGERPRATRVSGRPERPILLPTGRVELTPIPSVPGNRGPEVKNVSLVPYLGEIIGANAEMFRDGFDGVVNHKEVIAFDVAAWFALSWAGKIWRKITQPRNNY